MSALERLDYLEARSRYWGHGQGNAIADDLRQAVELARELAVALRTLVAAKDEKDANGDTPRYRELKTAGWRSARVLLAKLGD